MNAPFLSTRRVLGAALLLLASGLVGAQPTAPGANPVAAGPGAATARAVFAGGCFWCVEADFDKVPGVLSTVSGYTGGKVANPTYEMVAADRTGHAEIVEITFDPSKVSFEKLVDHFWRTVDPTTKDRQFCDVGSPYRTAIFAQDAEQLRIAQASKAALEKNKPFKDPVVTEIVLGGPVYKAEEYHQDYYRKNPVRYNYYRLSCGRDSRLKELWGSQAAH